MSGNEKKMITADELSKRFEDLNKNLINTNSEIGKFQQVLNQLQAKYQQILGAMQNTGELLAEIVGKEEAQKIIDSIQNLKQEGK